MVIQPTQQRRWSHISVLAISRIVALLLLSACAGATSQIVTQRTVTTPSPPTPAIDWKQVDQAMDKAGAMQPGGVYKYSFPRTDLNVTLSTVSLTEHAAPPGQALGSGPRM